MISIPVLRDNKRIAIVAPYIALSVFAAIAYCPVLFDFFVGDDFVHLDWLSRADANPWLIYQNFVDNWLQIPTTKFYRPLISVTLYLDHLLWGLNGLGFHITNLLFHIAGVFALYLTLSEAKQAVTGVATQPATGEATQADAGAAQNCSWLFPFAGALLFALHPIHPEAVAWITGRVDTVATAFYLSAVYFYTRWRRTQNTKTIVGSISCMILALMSKESAITIPMVCLAYEACIPSHKNTLRMVVSTTGLLVLVALAYLLVRRAALGTFIGGYDDSLLPTDWQQIKYNWTAAWQKIWLPTNHALVTETDTIAKIWQSLMMTASAVIASKLWLATGMRRLALFLLIWTCITVLPIFKLLYIGPDLQGARHAYLLSAPFCALMMLAVYPTYFKPDMLTTFRSSMALTFVAVWGIASGALLWINNGPWAEAGNQANAMKSSFRRLLSTVNEPGYFFGLPDNIAGAYLCRNAFGGLSNGKTHNLTPVSEDDVLLPIGHLKARMVESPQVGRLFRWDSKAWRFDELQRNRPVELKTSFKQSALNAIVKPFNKSTSTEFRDLKVVGTANDGLLSLELNLAEANPWSYDFIVVKGTTSPHSPSWPTVTANLECHDGASNAVVTSAEQRIHNQSVFVFACHRSASWLMLHSAQYQRLSFPGLRQIQIDSVEVIPAKAVLPQVAIEGAECDSNTGCAMIRKHSAPPLLVIDNDQVGSGNNNDASNNCFLEISQRNEPFPDDKIVGSKSNKITRIVRVEGNSASIPMSRDLFDAPGFYCTRVRVPRGPGAKLGLASDHIRMLVSE